MKRYILSLIFLAVIVTVALCFIPQNFAYAAARRAKDARCFVYCRFTDLPATNVGYGYIVECDASNLSAALSRCRDVDGVSLSFSANEEEFWSLVERCDFEKSKTEYFHSLVTVCGYTRKLSGGVYVGNVFTNLQLAYSDGTVYVGSPLILGSY